MEITFIQGMDMKKIITCGLYLAFVAILAGICLSFTSFLQLRVMSARAIESAETLQMLDDVPVEIRRDEILAASSMLAKYPEIVEKLSFTWSIFIVLFLFFIVYFLFEMNNYEGIYYRLAERMRNTFSSKSGFWGWIFILLGLIAFFNASVLTTFMKINSLTHIEYEKHFDREMIGSLVNTLKESWEVTAWSYYMMSLLLIIQGIYFICTSRKKINNEEEIRTDLH